MEGKKEDGWGVGETGGDEGKRAGEDEGRRVRKKEGKKSGLRILSNEEERLEMGERGRGRENEKIKEARN